MPSLRGFRSFGIAFLFSTTFALDLDVNDRDSVKSVAEKIANTIVTDYYDDSPGNAIGVFPDPYYWWEAGAVWGALVDYSFLTGDDQFDDMVTAALVAQIGENDAYMPANQTKSLGNDDQSTWGLAAMSAAENGFPETNSTNWADLAVNVFNTQAARWNEETCGGGLNWQIFTFNNGYTYKNSVSAGNFFLLSARLAQFTGNETYSEWATKTFDWAQEVGLVTEEYDVFDGADEEEDCETVSKIQFSSNHAVFTAGAAIMYNITNGDDKWEDAVTGFADSSSVFQDESTSVLTEQACRTGKCNIDQRAFKGLAISYYSRAAHAAPIVADTFNKIIEASAPAAAEQCTDDDGQVTCNFFWADTNASNTEGLSEAYSALQAVQVVLRSDAGALATANSTGNQSQSGSPTSDSPDETNESAAPTGAAGALKVSGGLLGAFTLLAALCL